MTFGKVGGETELWKQLYPSTSKLNMWPPHMNNIFKKKPSFPLTEILLLKNTLNQVKLFHNSCELI